MGQKLRYEITGWVEVELEDLDSIAEIINHIKEWGDASVKSVELVNKDKKEVKDG